MLWDFEKIHSKTWKLGKDHAIEVQLDRWAGAPLFAFHLTQRKTDQDHPGIRLSFDVLHGELSIEYYSAHHAPPKNKTTESLI